MCFSVSMAREFDDLGFWLPSEFLTEDELLTDFRADRLRAARFDDFSGGYVSSRGFNSDLSSPGELVASPTETESEDDDLVAELTRKLAQSSLRDYYSPDYASRVNPFYSTSSLSLSLFRWIFLKFP